MVLTYRANEKGRREAGLSKFQGETKRSVLRNHRAAESIVEACGEHIDVLTDTVGTGEQERGRGRDEGQIARAHEEMIVFESQRPVRREGEFAADSDHATPTGFLRRVEQHAVRGGEAFVLVAGD